MNVIWIVLSAFIGGLVAATLGWVDSGEPFAPRKFASSTIRAVIAAIGFAVAFNYSNHLSPLDILYAFLGGAGVDVLGNRISGAIRSSIKKEGSNE